MQNNEDNEVFTEKILKTIENIKTMQPPQLLESLENTAIENH